MLYIRDWHRQSMCMWANSDRNSIIPPYTSLSGSLKPHGINIASVNWLPLGKFLSYQQKNAESRCFSYFLWIAFFSKRLGFSVWPAWNPVTVVISQLATYLQLWFGCLWDISAGDWWDSAGPAFKVLKWNLRHNPLLWEHWHKQNKTDMVAF